MLNQKKVEIFLAKFHKSLAKQFLEVAYNVLDTKYYKGIQIGFPFFILEFQSSLPLFAVFGRRYAYHPFKEFAECVLRGEV